MAITLDEHYALTKRPMIPKQPKPARKQDEAALAWLSSRTMGRRTDASTQTPYYLERPQLRPQPAAPSVSSGPTDFRPLNLLPPSAVEAEQLPSASPTRALGSGLGALGTIARSLGRGNVESGRMLGGGLGVTGALAGTGLISPFSVPYNALPLPGDIPTQADVWRNREPIYEETAPVIGPFVEPAMIASYPLGVGSGPLLSRMALGAGINLAPEIAAGRTSRENLALNAALGAGIPAAGPALGLAWRGGGAGIRGLQEIAGNPAVRSRIASEAGGMGARERELEALIKRGQVEFDRAVNPELKARLGEQIDAAEQELARIRNAPLPGQSDIFGGVVEEPPIEAPRIEGTQAELPAETRMQTIAREAQARGEVGNYQGGSFAQSQGWWAPGVQGMQSPEEAVRVAIEQGRMPNVTNAERLARTTKDAGIVADVRRAADVAQRAEAAGIRITKPMQRKLARGDADAIAELEARIAPASEAAPLEADAAKYRALIAGEQEPAARAALEAGLEDVERKLGVPMTEERTRAAIERAGGFMGDRPEERGSYFYRAGDGRFFGISDTMRHEEIAKALGFPHTKAAIESGLVRLDRGPRSLSVYATNLDDAKRAVGRVIQSGFDRNDDIYFDLPGESGVIPAREFLRKTAPPPVATAAADNIATVPLDRIRTDPRLQARKTDPGKSYVEKDVAAIVRNFDPNKLDPLIVARDPADPNMFVLGGGHHRLEVLRRVRMDAPIRIVDVDISTPAGFAKFQEIADASNAVTKNLDLFGRINAFRNVGSELPGDIQAAGFRLSDQEIADTFDIGRLPADVIARVNEETALQPLAAEAGRAARLYGISEQDAAGLFRDFTRKDKGVKVPTRTAMRESIDKFGKQLADLSQSDMFAGRNAAEFVDRNPIIEAIRIHADLSGDLKARRAELRSAVKGARKIGGSEAAIRRAEREIAKIEKEQQDLEQNFARFVNRLGQRPAARSSSAVSGRPASTSATEGAGLTQRPAAGFQRSAETPPSSRQTVRTMAPSEDVGPKRTAPGAKGLGSTSEPPTPQVYHQRIGSVEEFGQAAEATRPEFRQYLDDLVADVPGARVVGDVDLKLDPKWGDAGARRVEQKMAEKGRTPDQIADYIRARVEVDSPEDLDAVLRKLDSPQEVDNFLDDPRPGGYRAVHVQTKQLGQGVSGEIQIVPAPLAKVQQQYHEAFNKWRAVGDELNSDQLAERTRDYAITAAGYQRAYNEWLGKPPGFNPTPDELEHLENLIRHGDWTEHEGTRIGAFSALKMIKEGKNPSDKQFALIMRALGSQPAKAPEIPTKIADAGDGVPPRKPPTTTAAEPPAEPPRGEPLPDVGYQTPLELGIVRSKLEEIADSPSPRTRMANILEGIVKAPGFVANSGIL